MLKFSKYSKYKSSIYTLIFQNIFICYGSILTFDCTTLTRILQHKNNLRLRQVLSCQHICYTLKKILIQLDLGS